MHRFGMVGVLLLVGAPLYAQDETAARKQAVEVMARVPFERAVKGAPYSADTIVDSSQTLADGNRIARKTTGRVYRDGEGRTRREEDRQDGTVGISITDPVAGVAYSLDPVKKIAWKTGTAAAGAIIGKLDASIVELKRKLEAEQASAQAQGDKVSVRVNGGGAGGGGYVTTAEPGGVMMRGGPVKIVADGTPLEHKTIEGVAVDGRKTTVTIPAGQVGNEQPITITSEEWSSPELNVLILTHHADPRMGESSYRLINIIRAEPDRSLFMVPSDYTVKETNIQIHRVEPSRQH
jgi:hypothetical protein